MMGELDLILPNGGGQFNDAVFPIDPRIFTGAGALAANTAYLVRFRVKKPITVSKIKIECVSAAGAGNVDVGIHTSDGTTWTKVAGPSAVAAVATGIMTLNLSAAYPLVPDVDYWATMACTEATSTFARLSVVAAAVGGLGNLCILKADTPPLDASFISPSAANIAPLFWLEV